MNSSGKEFLTTAIRRLKYYKDLGDKTFQQLSLEQLHFRPNEASNSIAMIVQHMTGNMLSRWTNFLTEDGEKPWRQRDDEFEEHALNYQQVLDLWEKGWACFLDALTSLSEDDLLKNGVHTTGITNGDRRHQSSIGTLSLSYRPDNFYWQNSQRQQLDQFINSKRKISAIQFQHRNKRSRKETLA